MPNYEWRISGHNDLAELVEVEDGPQPAYSLDDDYESDYEDSYDEYEHQYDDDNNFTMERYIPALDRHVTLTTGDQIIINPNSSNQVYDFENVGEIIFYTHIDDYEHMGYDEVGIRFANRRYEYEDYNFLRTSNILDVIPKAERLKRNRVVSGFSKFIQRTESLRIEDE